MILRLCSCTQVSQSRSRQDTNKQPKHRLVTDYHTGERLMDLHTTWEFIQQNARFREGVLDLDKVCNYLREQVQCDGQGPVFVEKCVIHALEASVIRNVSSSVSSA